MGLSLEVGILADLRENDEEGYEHCRNQFEALNSYLQQVQLPTHLEPEEGEVWSTDMYGYSGLHYLRRIAAHLDSTGKLPPPGQDNSSEDPVLKGYYEVDASANSSFISRLFKKQAKPKRTFDHLILHSDAEGYYLPLNFPDVLFPTESLEIAGGMVGSSYGLLDECKRIAAILEIPSELDETSDELWQAAETQGEGDLKWKRYAIESFSCVCLIKGCRKSIETKAALVFC